MSTDKKLSCGKENRVAYIDGCKGFAILLVIIGHIVSGNLNAGNYPEAAAAMNDIFNVIYSFHMPLFFCLSGFVYHRAYLGKGSRKFIVRLLDLIWTYFLWSTLLLAMKLIFADYVNTSQDKSEFFTLIIKPISVFWYIYVLIFLCIIFIPLSSEKIDPKLQICICAFFSAAGSFFIYRVQFPFEADKICVFSLYFAMGMLFSKKGGTGCGKKAGTVLCVFALLLCAVPFILGKFLLEIPAVGIAAAAIIVMAVVWLFENTAAGSFAPLCAISRYSLEIYVMHTFIVSACRTALPRAGITGLALGAVITLVLSAGLPAVVSAILKKIKLHAVVFRPASLISERIAAKK